MCLIMKLWELLENWLLVRSVIFLLSLVLIIVFVGVSILGMFGLFLGFFFWIMIIVFFKFWGFLVIVFSMVFFFLNIWVGLEKYKFFLFVILVMEFFGVRLFYRICKWLVFLMGFLRGMMIFWFLERGGYLVRFLVMVFFVIVM